MDQTTTDLPAEQPVSHRRRNIWCLILLLAMSIGLLAWVVAQPRRGPAALALPPNPTITPLPAKVVKNVVMVTFGFNDTDFTKMDNTIDQEALFGPQFSVRNYYAESSFGQWDITGSVHGPIRLSQTQSCDYTGLVKELDGKMAENGIAVTPADYVVYHGPKSLQTLCGIGGTAMGYGSHRAFVFNQVPSLLAHELGHSFGLYHSASTCGPDETPQLTAIPRACVSEYGDPFDVMGSDDKDIVYTYQLNGFSRLRLGMLTADSVDTVTTGGTYNIAPLVSNSIGSKMLVKIVDPDNTNVSYYLEYRQTNGYFDDFGPTASADKGVTVRVAPPDPTLTDQRSYLIDGHPRTPTLQDAAVFPGETMLLDHGKVKLECVSISQKGAIIRIVMP